MEKLIDDLESVDVEKMLEELEEVLAEAKAAANTTKKKKIKTTKPQITPCLLDVEDGESATICAD